MGFVSIKGSTEAPKIPYQLVSMAAILRDHINIDEQQYVNDTHEKLTDIADSIYNVGEDVVERFKDEYKPLYDQYGKAYFDQVLDDMEALDGQVNSDAKVEELLADFEDRCNIYKGV